MYSIRFVYNDSKDLIVNVEENDLKNFFSCLDRKELFFHDNYELGFWTNIDTVRYIEIKRIPDSEEKQVEQETKDRSESISQENREDSAST